MTASSNDALLKLLHHVLVRIRIAAGRQDLGLAYDLANSFEELPMKVLRRESLVGAERSYDHVYLRDLFERYPELTAVRREWLNLIDALGP